MATKDTVVQELVVNTLTHKQFKAAQEAGTLSPYELYGTPDTSVRLPVLTPMWFDHLANDVSWLRADTFSWQSGDVYVAAYEHLTEDLESANRLFLAWVSGADTVYTLDENAGTDVYKQSTSGYMAKQSHYIATGSSVEDERTGDVYTRDSSKDIESKALYTDTIGGNEISYYLASDGHKICLPDQESNISALYEATGAADYYLLDTTNKQFKLPRKQKRRLIQAAKNTDGTWYNLYSDGWVEQGGYKEISTGGSVTISLPITMADTNYSAQMTPAANATGTSPRFAIIKSNLTTTTVKLNWYSYNDGQAKAYWQVSGYAAESEYASAGMNLEYYYVGNFEQDSVEQTAGLNAELFNGKADRNLLNTTDNVDFVIESQLPTEANGYTWYRKYKSGWVEQGGQTSVGEVTNEIKSVSLPVEMSDNAYWCSISWVGREGSSGAYSGVTKDNSSTTTTLALKCWTTATHKCYWQVSGMSA